MPETWQRAYEGLRSRNLTAQTIDSGFMMLLAVGLLVTIVWRVRGRDVPWRLAAGVGGVGALLYFLANWNAQPLADFSYPTTDSYASFLAQEFLRNLTGALAAGVSAKDVSLSLLAQLGVNGASGFAEEFSARGPRDSRGRSLRDFDLRTRIFKYPCSYLIYSAAFDAIPAPAKEYIYRRLFEILSGREQGPEFASLSGEDRRAILEILVATKPGLPEEWKQSVRQVQLETKSERRLTP